MADNRTYENLALVAVVEPEYTSERRGDGSYETTELPGLLRIGAIVDGVFVEIFVTKAGVLTNSAAQAARAAAKDAKTPAAKG